jgi:hypothetical protein
MGLAKKGSRKINVENTEYRWTVSPDDGFMVIVVEKRENPGQRLSVQIGYDDERSHSGVSVQRQKITPSLIRQVILKARSLGWTPTQRGKELCLRLQRDNLVPIRDS